MIVLKKGNMWCMCEMLCTEFVDCLLLFGPESFVFPFAV